MNQQEEQYLQRVEQELANESLLRSRAEKEYGQVSMFSGTQSDNLARYQLDLSEELERIDHLLRGDTLKRDGEGNEFWVEEKDESLKPFNDYGVKLLMKIISFYVNRNTILSNYDEEIILEKMEDFGTEIADLIYMKYQEMGMDTIEKRKLYPIIVRALVDTVHSTYLRAAKGEERRTLRQNIHISQTDSLNKQSSYQTQTPQSNFSVFKPRTWGKS